MDLLSRGDEQAQAYAGAFRAALVGTPHFSLCNVTLRGPLSCIIMADLLKVIHLVSQHKLGS